MRSGRGRVDDRSRARGFGDGLGNAQILQAVPGDEKDRGASFVHRFRLARRHQVEPGRREEEAAGRNQRPGGASHWGLQYSLVGLGPHTQMSGPTNTGISAGNALQTLLRVHLLGRRQGSLRRDDGQLPRLVQRYAKLPGSEASGTCRKLGQIRA